MMQLGQMQTYEHIMSIYGKTINEDNLPETILKLLVRCMYGFDSIERLRVIFKMQQRHEKLMKMLGVEKAIEDAVLAASQSMSNSNTSAKIVPQLGDEGVKMDD